MGQIPVMQAHSMDLAQAMDLLQVDSKSEVGTGFARVPVPMDFAQDQAMDLLVAVGHSNLDP